MRDDLGKTFDLPSSAKRYIRMKGAFGVSPAKAQLYIDSMADITNQKDRQHGFANKDAAGEVSHAIKEAEGRTLVLHMRDRSTDFLTPIYAGKGYTVNNGSFDRASLIQAIQSHDRVMLMGHGSPGGLFWPNGMVGHEFGPLLANKPGSLFIWCNADAFAKRHKLTGFVTGMFISEVGEAAMFGIKATQQEINASNDLFSQTVRQYVDGHIPPSDVCKGYTHATCQVTKHNNERLYVFDAGSPTPAFHPKSLALDPWHTGEKSYQKSWSLRAPASGSNFSQQHLSPNYDFGPDLDLISDEELDELARRYGWDDSFTESVRAHRIVRTMLEDEDEVEDLAASVLRPTVIDVKFDKVGWKEVEIPAKIIAQFQKLDWMPGLEFLFDYLDSAYHAQFGLMSEVGDLDHLHSGGRHPVKVYGKALPIEPL